MKQARIAGLYLTDSEGTLPSSDNLSIAPISRSVKSLSVPVAGTGVRLAGDFLRAKYSAIPQQTGRRR